MLANRETTPDLISDDILTFADDLGAAPPIYVSICPPPDALVGDRAENIERQCRSLGGAPLFGRATFCADDLYLVSEFHCVVSTPQGLIDVTPSATGETRTLFAAYPRLEDWPGLYRPNIRARVYGAADKKAEVEGKLLVATDSDETSARKNGITLRQLLLSKLPRDPLAADRRLPSSRGKARGPDRIGARRHKKLGFVAISRARSGISAARPPASRPL
jgi:hypothetical protein